MIFDLKKKKILLIFTLCHDGWALIARGLNEWQVSTIAPKYYMYRLCDSWNLECRHGIDMQDLVAY